MTGVPARLAPSQQARLVKTGMPDWTRPMLATLTHEYFSSDEWIYERKLDGERCLVFRDGRGLRIFSRNHQRLDDTYPELADAMAEAGPQRFIADGEIVAFRGRRTSFSRLQQRIGISDPDKARVSGVRVHLYLFDLLYLDQYRLDSVTLRDRKRLLHDAFSFGGLIHFTPHRNREGEAYFEKACRKGWEGVIAKKADSRYIHARSRNWLKFKCENRQEFVIGGFTRPRGKRKGFGALLVGYHENGKLRYAGKVGTGFDERMLEELHERLKKRQRRNSPFGDPVRESGVVWVKPDLVGEISFTEWTRAGKLRHPRFVGLRGDKPAGKVVRERAVDA